MKNLLLLILLVTTSFAASSQQYGWTDISTNVTGNADLSDVFFVSDDEGWMSISNEAIILHTSDGGETFEIQITQYPTEAIYMIDENEGYAGGANGRVYRTTDGGENWIAIGSISVTLTDIDFATTTQGYCCGDNGTVFSITPEGVENLNSGLASDLSGISAPSVDKVWICGGNNIVLYDGSDFTFQTGPVGTYNAIFFIDDTEGWVGGDSGILGHTENSGISWENQAPGNPSDESLFDTFFLTSEVGWMVGANGTIIETSNGGENWEIVGSGLTTSLLRGVHFTSPTNGYIVGGNKTLLKYGVLTGTSNAIDETPAFEVYPNPCQEKLTVRDLKPKTRHLKLEIMDISGRVVCKNKYKELREYEIVVDMGHLPAGIYLLTLQTEDALGVKKIIKK